MPMIWAEEVENQDSLLNLSKAQPPFGKKYPNLLVWYGGWEIHNIRAIMFVGVNVPFTRPCAKLGEFICVDSNHD